jgi:hypothetical protein
MRQGIVYDGERNPVKPGVAAETECKIVCKPSNNLLSKALINNRPIVTLGCFNT